MSYQHIHVQHEHHPPPGYPQEYPQQPDFPPPPPRPGFPNPSPPPQEYGYQGYFYEGYQPPSAAPPPLRPYHTTTKMTMPAILSLEAVYVYVHGVQSNPIQVSIFHPIDCIFPVSNLLNIIKLRQSCM
ncbi:cysteine-rich and transmembrane domain-containing protein A-like [Prunus yedoensis var. nudiflora]|uniref:Cysteine-rich and transmembrane domain-containing protein A-like n=1 Tax=Prunus yedoensis var. nudiflora TaxID=2094558 RepID=A0A315AAJ9_PRUYE|nr:cysteine-rich and transmembrane domain-containing protein A-like [Prunus yedoensis var. nudiflora]